MARKTRTRRAARRNSRKPSPPFPRQAQPKPGLESKLRPAPAYRAPAYRAAGKLEGKVALITGGDSGIGRAVAVLFAREGADIAIVYLRQEQRDAEQVREVVEALGRRALLLPADLRRLPTCRRVVRETVKTLGGLDILVNNAAFQQHQPGIEAVTDAQVARTLQVNVQAMFAVTRAALEHLPPGGAIVNTGSVTGLRGHPELLDYASTKGAIHAFTKSLAASLVSRGIRVNCVAPGPVWTPLNVADQSADRVAQFGSQTPFGRPAQPEEIAPAYVFFASTPDSSFITGEVLAQLGGDTTAG